MAYLYLFTGLVPTDFPGICYEGDGEKIAGLVWGLADMWLSDQLGIYGSRYQDTQWVFEDYAEELEQWLASDPAWTGWDTTSTDVLLMVSYSDSGDDLNAEQIPRCQ